MLERDFFGPDVFRPDFFSNFPRDFYSLDNFRPWENVFRSWEKMFPAFDDLSSKMNQLRLQDVGSSITFDNEKFQVNIDVQHFAPEEISVKVVDGHVTVEGKHEEKKDEHGYISRQFVRRYALPQGCLPDTVESKLSSDGVLSITAPTVIALPSSGEKIVSIQHTGPVKQIKSN